MDPKTQVRLQNILDRAKQLEATITSIDRGIVALRQAVELRITFSSPSLINYRNRAETEFAVLPGVAAAFCENDIRGALIQLAMAKLQDARNAYVDLTFVVDAKDERQAK